MAWPPPLPPTTRTNATPELDAHALDHNQLANALTVLVAKGTQANPWTCGAAINPGAAGGNISYWWRVGSRVFVDTMVIMSAGFVAPPAGTQVQLVLPFAASATYPATGNNPYLPRPGMVQCQFTTPGSTAYVGLVSVVPGTATATVLFIVSGAWVGMNGSHLNAAGMNVIGSFNYTTDAAP